MLGLTVRSVWRVPHYCAIVADAPSEINNSGASSCDDQESYQPLLLCDYTFEFLLRSVIVSR